MKETSTTDVCLLPNIPDINNDPLALSQDFQRYLMHHLGRFQGCNPYFLYYALSLAIRDRVMENWRETWLRDSRPNTRRAYYLSLEFLIGRSLANHLLNLDLKQPTEVAMQQFSLAMEDLIEQEHDAGLGNGGLGRLAACFMDSCATLNLPVLGYGIRYEYGMFRQHIENGYQVENPDHWLVDGNPWELERHEYAQTVHFGGYTEHFICPDGRHRSRWISSEQVLAIPYDVPVSGYNNGRVNTLRLWKSTATNEFNLDEFNAGDYAESVATKNTAEHISMVLYPNDSNENGKELRLKQQYFLASASLQDILERWIDLHGVDFSQFAAQNVFQMNDTHPTIAVAELMRLLMDDYRLSWDSAWKITTQTMAYTNHTLLPEALERWPVPLFERLLPRLLEIIYDINARFMDIVSCRWPGDTARLRRMSIIEEGPVKQIRMAYLAIVSSFSVNGVAALHSNLLQQGLFADFYALWPEKFNNKTNGVTPRRWIAHANPAMSRLISQKIGHSWIGDLSQIEQLKPFAKGKKNQPFHKAWAKAKLENKERLAAIVERECGIRFDTESMFDVQVKRIHEYKRQLLNILHVIHLYRRLKSGDCHNWTNRAVLIGGKAAPGYMMAKQIIKLINNVAHVVNHDSDIGNRLKVAFFPNYSVSAMEIIAPGTDLSEQISTAGKEASGTGNMKFMMNGALTIGTYDGANIEILEAVGAENFFLFGLKADEVSDLRQHYRPQSYIDNDTHLQAVMQLLTSGHFNRHEPGLFDDIIRALLNPHDPWLTLADFSSYVTAQQQAAEAYQDQSRWIKMSILNSASSGFFSTDRTISHYNNDIWKLTPITA
ncbi:glycogen/starch/alpha-glucan phosphorylase [Ectothiorhodospiraceae bacterium BW-2]|nr:glycogen/starch/alpha-glucan phosphorylase [Ectothiorhodospiraceae bacterium BW-2]